MVARNELDEFLCNALLAERDFAAEHPNPVLVVNRDDDVDDELDEDYVDDEDEEEDDEPERKANVNGTAETNGHVDAEDDEEEHYPDFAEYEKMKREQKLAEGQDDGDIVLKLQIPAQPVSVDVMTKNTQFLANQQIDYVDLPIPRRSAPWN